MSKRTARSSTLAPANLLTLLLIASMVIANAASAAPATSTDVRAGLPPFRLGNEVLLARYRPLVAGRRVGLITNQTGVDSQGRSLIDILAADPAISLVALYAPEHGIDGQALAGEYVSSYTHPRLGIPVYSLYGATRMPTQAMLAGVDVLLYDIQDIGARTYTYISTLNYAMRAAEAAAIPVVVLDRSNPLGGVTVEGPVLEDAYKTFVGVDNLPMAHGMTVGELSQYFNRLINVDLTVVPMEGYSRQMTFQDTGLTWVQSSPNVPDIDSVYGYMATGLGEGTGIYQQDKFKWIGGRGIDPQLFASLLLGCDLPGVNFVPETINGVGGVRLLITDYRRFNPAKTGLYSLAYAKRLTDFAVPKSGSGTAAMVMFDKVMGTNRVGQWLEAGLTPREIEARYAQELADFVVTRERYLIYGQSSRPGQVTVVANNVVLHFDSPPYIDASNRTMVPMRAIGEALGAELAWDEVQRVVTMVRGELKVTLQIDSALAMVNNRAVLMDTTAVIRNGRTMVPARYVSELLGCTVDWNDEHAVVTIR
jgi:uncharacterized protein YbbC (DUF1343 family)